MKRVRLLSLLLLAAALHPAATRAQTAEADSVAPPRKSAAAAAGLEYLVPTLGHAYAGSWTRGLPPAALMFAGAAIAIEGSDGCGESGCEAFAAGLGMVAVGKIWGIFSAMRTAQARNAADRVTVALGPALRSPGLELRVRW